MGRKLSTKERFRIGLDFFEFLRVTSRANVTDATGLRDIYNTEFRERNQGKPLTNFGSVMFALKKYDKIRRQKGAIVFQTTVREIYVDQWQPARGYKQRTAQNRPANPGPVQNLPSSDGEETHDQIWREQASLLMVTLQENRKDLISDKHGIRITSEQEFIDGKINFTVKDTGEFVVNVNVTNTGTNMVHFTTCTPLSMVKYLSLTNDVAKKTPLQLQPGDSHEIQVHFSCSYIGFYPATLAFEFKSYTMSSPITFHIVRDIETYCLTALGQELQPVARYTPSICPVIIPEAELYCQIVDGQRPDKLSTMQLKCKVPLKMYKMPGNMNQLIESLKSDSSSQDKTLLGKPLSMENYSKKFQWLLHLEEHQLSVDITKYNMDNVCMSRDPNNNQLLILEVPGVSENRPSVLREDQLLVHPAGKTDKKYRGYVHSVQLDKVRLGFSSELLEHFMEGMKFHVEFTVNRIVLRVLHRAAELAPTHNLGNVLFPAEPTSSSQEPEIPPLRLFNRQLEKNPEQMQAVSHIVAGSSKPAPYLVFGPPGTGKTVTLVEAIKQVEKAQASCHILVCAPSNSAVDLLCSMIANGVETRKLYRMYASNHDPNCVPENLKAYSNLDGGNYVFPAAEKLMEYKIIATTLITAGRLVSGKVQIFTHVFVDEAGQAMETECVVPLAGLLRESAQVVLAGDPKQLGPIVRSPFALKYGMGVSFLQRLMTGVSLYEKKEGVFNRRYVTKLLRNYRSHPAILKIPNELFYEGELEAHADEMLRNSCCGWAELQKTGFPVIFHGVTGIDERESTSPSFFNRAEVEVLVEYVKKLLQTQGKKGLGTISSKDIGIIAPYRRQVLKIRQALNKIAKDIKFKDMNTLKVGSVEEFQGQERKVIIVSTVRSNCIYAEIDKKFSLGFVKNEKRFNVAVTRAKALLIVVGNPNVLKDDPSWGRFIQYCKEEGGYRGYTVD